MGTGQTHDGEVTAGRWNRIGAWIAIPLFLASIVLLWRLDIRATFDSPLLRVLLNLFCVTMASAFVACLVGCRFLSCGETGLLLLGSGTLLWSVSGFISTLTDRVPGANLWMDDHALVTIQTLSAWLASVCFLTGAVLQTRIERAVRRRALWMAAAYTLILAIVSAISVAALAGVLPPFFKEGSINTFVRHLTLGTALLMLLMTAIHLLRTPSPFRPAYHSWYAQSLLLQATGLLGALLCQARDTPLDWAATLAQQAGCLYMVGAAVASLRPSTDPPQVSQSCTPPHMPLHYGIAIVAACSAIVLRLFFLSFLGTRATYLIFYPAVMLSALYGGFRTGLLASLLSAVLANFFLIDPIGRLGYAHRADAVATAIFLASCTAISWLAEAMRRAQRRAAEALAETRHAIERADTAERLHSQQQFLSAVLQTVGSFVVVLDREGRIAHFNHAAEAATGYSLAEVRGACFWDTFIPPEEAPAFRQLFSQFCAGHAASDAESIWVMRDGSRRLCHWMNTRLTDLSGNIQHIICTGIDITDRKQAENVLVETHHALKHERDLLQAVMEGATNTHLVYLDRSFNFVRVNTAFAASRGFHPEEMTGKNFFRLCPDAELEAAFTRARDTGEPFEAHDRPFEFANQPQRGITYWNLALTPIKDSSAGANGLILSLYETTDRLRVEREKLHSEKRLDLVLQSSQTGTFEVDLATGEGFWNDVEYELLGVKPGEVPSTPDSFFRFVHPDDLKTLKAEWQTALHCGALDAEFRVVRADGQVRWLASKGRFASDTGNVGQPKRFLGVNFDITSRKTAEKALRLSESKYRTLFENMAEGFSLNELIYDDRGKPVDWRVLEVNAAYTHHTGVESELVVGHRISEVNSGAVYAYLPIFAKLVESQQPVVFDTFAADAGRHLHVVAFPTEGSHFACIIENISDRRRTQIERDLTIEFLRMVNASKSVSDLLRSSAQFFKERSGCDCVGIRMKVGNDFPYREAIGFPPEFLEADTSLCASAPGRSPSLTTCLCGQVLQGRMSIKGLSLTSHGSFWTNDTMTLRSLPVGPQNPLPDRCILESYGSLALVPLHEGPALKGLLQLNAKRKNAFTPDSTSLWERLADYLAIAVSKFQAEEALRQSRARFQLLAAATFEGIAIIDEGRIVETNAQLARMLGRTRSELIGVAIESLLPLEDRIPVSRAFCVGCESTIEHRMVLKDGTLITVESHGKPWSIDGRHNRLIAIRDITSRKRIEEALRTSEARFRNVFDHAATGIAVTDCGGRFVQCNAAYCDLLGYDQTELASMSFPALIHPDDRPQNMALIDRLVSGLIPSFETENRYVSKGGRVVWVHKYVSIMRNDDGRPSHIVALVTDTTQRKQTEDVLRFLSQCDTPPSGEGFFQNLARFLSQTLEMEFVCIDRLVDNLLSAHTIAMYHNGEFEDNVRYSLKDTPCGDVVGNRICCFAKSVQSLFPKDAVLRTLKAESYVGTTLWDSQGNPIGLIAVIGRTPLTDTRRAEAIVQLVAVRASGELERQQAEEALRESRSDLNRAQVVAHVGSWRLNVLRNELRWSEESWRIFGVPTGTPLTYETFLGTVHPDDRGFVHDKWNAALRGEPYDIEHRIVVGDTVKWVRERAELEFDPEGTLLGGFGTTQDITDKKQAEAVKARYELIAQYARDPLLLLDLDGSIMEANQAAVQLYEYPREKLLGMRLYALSQDDAEVVDLQMEQALSGGVLYETCHIRMDGSGVPVEVSSRGVTISGKTMLLSVIRDISQRKETEQTLRHAKEEAERASKAKSDFLAAMSHELRTPLNAVMGFSQVLGNEYFGPLSDKQREYVTDIYESGRHLLSLINDILDLSKIEAGKMEPLWTTFDIGALLENSLVLIREKCAKHGIRLSADLPASVRGLQVVADERRMKQVLYNLLSNATKFTPDGGSIQLQAVLTDEQPPMIQVAISDSGIGLSPEHQTHVFEAFYQVQQGVSDKTPGTGLGLCLVDQLITMHGGRIWVDSDGPDRGSRFTFAIPVDARAAVTPAAETQP